MGVQYRTNVSWDTSLRDLQFLDSTNPDPTLNGLVQSAVKTTTGAPTATAGYFMPGAIIQNAVDGTFYVNTGTTAAPVFTIVSSATPITAKLSLSSAQILALNGTPITLVAAPGSGKTIVPISVIGRMNFLTAAYATNLQLQVKYSAGADALFVNSTLLAATSGNPIQPLFPVAAGSVTGNDNEYIANADLLITVGTGNPATGAGTLDLYITYAVVTL